MKEDRKLYQKQVSTQQQVTSHFVWGPHIEKTNSETFFGRTHSMYNERLYETPIINLKAKNHRLQRRCNMEKYNVFGKKVIVSFTCQPDKGSGDD